LFNTLIGDVNNDGFVTITDAIALVNIILGKAEKVAAADINGDGLVTITDVIALVNIILEKKTP
ncbi:MAG: dockerin type I repeat-containing protein, partial [Prevotella sp.]|nr:dockerin type I repeat-containing protein [Prevotella sp.]